MELGETEFKFRFTSLRRNPFREKNENFWETEYEFRFIKMWNGFCNPFQKKNSNFFETDYRIRFTFLWNEIRIPFPKNFQFFPKADYVIHFKMVWNGCQHAFHKDSVLFFFGVQRSWRRSKWNFTYILMKGIIVNFRGAEEVLEV